MQLQHRHRLRKYGGSIAELSRNDNLCGGGVMPHLPGYGVISRGWSGYSVSISAALNGVYCVARESEGVWKRHGQWRWRRSAAASNEAQWQQSENASSKAAAKLKLIENVAGMAAQCRNKLKVMLISMAANLENPISQLNGGNVWLGVMAG